MQNVITSLIFFIWFFTSFSLHCQTSADGFFAKANDYFDGKDYAKAIDYFDISISKNPDNTRALYNRSMAFYELEKYNKALTDLNNFMELHPEDTDAAELRANLKFLLKDFRGSIEDYNKSLKRDPSNIVYINRAGAKLNLGNYQDALDDTEEALAMAPDDVEAYIIRADIYFELGEYNHALEAYDTALRLLPDEARVLNNRGNCYLEMGETDSALADYNRAIQVSSESGSFVNRAYLYLDRKNAEAALLDCMEASIIDPSNSDAYNCIGLARQMAGETGQAMVNFDKAIELDPRPDFFMNRGKLNFDMGDLESALNDFSNAEKEEPNLPELGNWIIRTKEALSSSGQSEEEQEEGDDYLDDGPADIETGQEGAASDQYDYKGNKGVMVAVSYKSRTDLFLQKALELNEKGFYTEALRLFNEVIRNDKTNAGAHHGRAVAYVYLDNIDLAIQGFSNAIRLDNGQIASLYNRGVLNFDLGNYELARRDFSRVLAKNSGFSNAAMLWQECDLKLLNLR